MTGHDGVIFVLQDRPSATNLAKALSDGIDVHLHSPIESFPAGSTDDRWRFIGHITRDREGMHAFLAEGCEVRDLLTLCGATRIALTGGELPAEVVHAVSGEPMDLWKVLVPWAEDLMGEL